MILLGLDTSAVVCSAALMEDGVELASFSRREGLTHSEVLLPGILDMIKKSGKSLSDVDAIAVSVGPGSFTGLRIGIATAKGLAYDRDLPCVPVSTLEALAENAREQNPALVCAVMDARRGEYYNALFAVENSALRRQTEDRAISGDALTDELKGFERIIILGDGADKFVSAHREFIDFLAPDSIRWQSALSVCRVAKRYFESERVSCRRLAPRYLRLPQAEREWNKKQKKK